MSPFKKKKKKSFGGSLKFEDQFNTLNVKKGKKKS